MKIVIEIPEDIYDGIKNNNLKHGTFITLINAVLRGKVLKGRARLIDANELYNSLEFPTEQFASAFKQMLNDAPAIIEADKESEAEL